MVWYNIAQEVSLEEPLLQKSGVRWWVRFRSSPESRAGFEIPLGVSVAVSVKDRGNRQTDHDGDGTFSSLGLLPADNWEESGEAAPVSSKLSVAMFGSLPRQNFDWLLQST